jgi:hypothetical protein
MDTTWTRYDNDAGRGTTTTLVVRRRRAARRGRWARDAWRRGIGPGRRFGEGDPTEHGLAGGSLPRRPGPAEPRRGDAQRLRWRALWRPGTKLFRPAVFDWVFLKFLKHVTEPPKIVPYYRLSLSTWPLGNNKELFCRFRRVKPGKSLTIGSRYALSPHEGGTRVQHDITKSPQVQHYYKPGFSYIKVNMV